MTKEEIFEYVMNTPHNTNPAILKDILNRLPEPEPENFDVEITNISSWNNPPKLIFNMTCREIWNKLSDFSYDYSKIRFVVKGGSVSPSSSSYGPGVGGSYDVFTYVKDSARMNRYACYACTKVRNTSDSASPVYTYVMRLDFSDGSVNWAPLLTLNAQNSTQQIDLQ